MTQVQATQQHQFPFIQGLTSASAHRPGERLPSDREDLNGYLEGGLPIGAICEWGLPPGQGGREIVLRWLSPLTQQGGLCLWVCSQEDLLVYPPAWSARGVDLEKMRFAYTTSPLQELKPALMASVFKLIVLDAPKKISEDDLAFIAHQARKNGYIFMLLRNYLLTPQKGNVRARLRLNCRRDLQGFKFECIKGLSAKNYRLRGEI